MREIINTSQSNILQALADTNWMSRPQLCAASGVHRQKLGIELHALADRYLVDRVLEGTGNAHKIHITPAGEKALRDHINHRDHAGDALEIAQSSKRSLFSLPLYVPPKSVYYRNNGNSHIPSRGM